MTSTEAAGSVLVVGPAGNGLLRHELEARGHDVIECAGPSGARRCPIVETGRCPLVDQADGIVMGLDLSVEAHRDILACYRARAATGPLAVVAGDGAPSIDLGDVEVIEGHPTERAITRFSERVDLAASARQALSELSGLGHGY